MIFSLDRSSVGEINFQLPNTHIFCFFHSEKMISVPEPHWLLAIAASLKLKKNVLILESVLLEAPDLETTARWLVEPSFLWLAPRSLSVLLEAHDLIPTTYKCLKVRLTCFK